MATTKNQTVKSFKQYLSLYKRLSGHDNERIEENMYFIKENWEVYLSDAERYGEYDTYNLFGGIGYDPREDEQIALDINHITERW